jgi:hypothetical protein
VSLALLVFPSYLFNCVSQILNGRCEGLENLRVRSASHLPTDNFCVKNILLYEIVEG